MCRDRRRCSDCNNSGCCNKCEAIMRYTGPDIDCVGVATGDTYETVTGKLSDFICNGFDDDGVEIVAGENITVTEETVEGVKTYTINSTGEGSGCCGIIDSTYGDLTALRDSNSLVKGQLYLMTDFQTIYDQPDYSDVNTPKTSVVTKVAVVDPIILLAISTTEFAKEVWRPSTPRHTLEYDIDFSQTEVMGVPAKGRITYCKDELSNETHYDHTVVLLKRYESVSGSGIFNSFWDTGFGSTEVLTFETGCFSNKIRDNYYELTGGFAVSNNVLGTDSIVNIIGTLSNNNTFGNDTYANTFGDSTGHNTFGDGVQYNTFGDDIMYNTFGSSTRYNTFGSSTRYNTFGNNTQNNTLGDYIQSNTFGNSTQYNTFGNNTSGNTFGELTLNNTFGNNTSGNTFGDDTQNNTFGISQYNIFGNDTLNNIFGNDTLNNTFGDGTYNNTFGNDIQSIDFTITPTPTHIYGNYPCNIFKRQDGTVRLSYCDNTDVLVVVNPTD